MSLPLEIDLSGKVAVVTGAGGVLCGIFSKALAQSGAKVALLDINLEAAQKCAAQITAEGYTAKAYQANVLDKESLLTVKEEIHRDLGICDILLNGAGWEQSTRHNRQRNIMKMVTWTGKILRLFSTLINPALNLYLTSIFLVRYYRHRFSHPT